MKKAKIIVLSGQSNAVGVGYVKYLSNHFSKSKIQEYSQGYRNIKINYYSHDKKSNGFTVTTMGCTELHKETLGPELGIAEYLSKKYPTEEFYIVKFAVGGASLHHDFLSPSSGGCHQLESYESEYSAYLDAFLKGKPVKAGWCYNGLVNVLKNSISQLERDGLSPEIIGFCWMQGESDAGSLEAVSKYRRCFDNFISDFKAEFHQYLDACSFVDAGISPMWDYYKEMNTVKKEYAENHNEFHYLDTIKNGLTTQYEPIEEPDIAHYDCKSVITLGRLFGENIC